jgi:hypothetical protein
MTNTNDIYVICYEGEAEITLFGFLKKNFCKNNKTFKPELIEGFNTFDVFKRKYVKIIKKWSFKPTALKQKIHFIFLIDRDLDDSPKIEKFIRDSGHTVQFCDPNTEAVLLRLAGVNLVRGTTWKDFRSKCKTKSKEHFGQEAHKMKDTDFTLLIKDEATFAKAFPHLNSIFND